MGEAQQVAGRGNSRAAGAHSVLIGLLLSRPGAPVGAVSATASTPSGQREPSTPSSSGTETPSSQPSASSESTESPGPGFEMVSSTRLLTMSSDTQGWRATVGNCETPGLVEATDDGGKTWQGVADVDLAPVSRIQAVEQDTVFVIGGDPNSCDAKYLISYTSGAEWEARSQPLQGSWYRAPRNHNEVRASTGNRSTPCGGEIIDLAAIDDQNAAVLCTGGSVRSSKDAGNTGKRSAP